MRILVVDDENISRKKMERIMQQFGNCTAVASGIEAIAVFQKAWADWAPFALITLDVSMPDMDGTETLLEIRQIESDKNVPPENRARILMATARSDAITVATSIQAGCDGYLFKPFNREMVSNELAKLWRETDGPPLARTICLAGPRGS